MPSGQRSLFRTVLASGLVAALLGGCQTRSDPSVDDVGAPIRSAIVTCTNTATTKAFDATSVIGAEGADELSGVVQWQGGLSYVDDGDSVRLRGVDFGATDVRGKLAAVRMATPHAGNKVVLRLDCPTGPIIGTLVTSATGAAFDTYQTRYLTLGGDVAITGLHHVYVTFDGAANLAACQSQCWTASLPGCGAAAAQGCGWGIGNFDWFQLATGCPTATPFFDGTTCVAACPAGTFTNGTTCVAACPAGTFTNGTACVAACPAGTFTNGTACVAACPSGTFTNGTACVAACPAGSVPVGGVCTTCPAGSRVCNGACVANSLCCPSPADLQLIATKTCSAICDYRNACLRGADLTGILMNGSIIDFRQADLTGATLAGAQIVATGILDWRGANLTGANLAGGVFQARGIHDLRDALFTGANLTNAQFIEGDGPLSTDFPPTVSGANFCGAVTTGLTFTPALQPGHGALCLP